MNKILKIVAVCFLPNTFLWAAPASPSPASASASESATKIATVEPKPAEPKAKVAAQTVKKAPKTKLPEPTDKAASTGSQQNAAAITSSVSTPKMPTEDEIIAEKKETFLKNGFTISEFETVAPIMKDIRKRRRLLFRELSQLLMKFEFLTRGKIMTPGKRLDTEVAEKELKKLQIRFIQLSQKISQIEIDSMNALKDKLEVKKWFLAFKILGQSSPPTKPANRSTTGTAEGAGNNAARPLSANPSAAPMPAAAPKKSN